jgi:DNA-binding response OmpR family regulator
MHPSASPPSQEVSRPAATVLLIDGDADSVEIYSIILHRQGYRVVAARDGRSGLALALSLRPDLVIFELYLPLLDGHDLLEKLRGDARTALTPVIILDSIPSVSPSLFEPEYFALRLIKPCEPSRLLEAVYSVLGEPMVVVA